MSHAAVFSRGTCPYERRLPWDISVDVAYVGTAKNGGFTDIDANASDVPNGGNESRPLTSIRGNSSLLLWGPQAKSRYHSLQVAINRPFKNGLMLKGAYTLSKAQNMVDDDGWSQFETERTQLARSQLLQRRLRQKAHLPDGVRVRAALQDQLRVDQADGLHIILGDWQVNGIFSAVSGLPFTVYSDNARLNMPGTPQYADITGDFNVVGGHGGSEQWFDPSVFSQPGTGATREHQAQPVLRPRLQEHGLLVLPCDPGGIERQARRVPRRDLQPDELAEVGSARRQPCELELRQGHHGRRRLT